jgi:hypothetical protein
VSCPIPIRSCQEENVETAEDVLTLLNKCSITKIRVNAAATDRLCRCEEHRSLSAALPSLIAGARRTSPCSPRLDSKHSFLFQEQCINIKVLR